VPANILNLPAYTVTAIEQNDHDYHIDAVAKEPPGTCPHCQSSNLVGFGHRSTIGAADILVDAVRHGDIRRFVLIGGWAVWLYTQQLKSKDIDIVIDLPTLDALKSAYEIEKNHRLKTFQNILKYR